MVGLPPRSVSGDASGQLGGAEAVQVVGLVQVAGVALRLGEHRDDFVGAAERVFVGSAALTTGTDERRLAGGLAHELAVGRVELEPGQLLLGELAAGVGGLRENGGDGMARH
jgi:hypothetical protein